MIQALRDSLTRALLSKFGIGWGKKQLATCPTSIRHCFFYLLNTAINTRGVSFML